MRPIDKELIRLVIISNGVDNFKEIKKIIEHGADVNIQDKYNKEFNYFIDFAISLNNKKINEYNIMANTPLHWAVIVNSPKVVKLLLENGANPNIKNEVGMVPLHSVFKEENTNLLIPKFLIENGANPNIQEEELYTPLHFAIYFNRNLHVIKQLFIKNTVNVNIVNKLNFSPLHYAVQRNNFEMVKFLIDKDANPNIKEGSDCQSLSPIDLCKNENIKKILLEKQIKNINLLGENQPSTSGYKPTSPKI